MFATPSRRVSCALAITGLLALTITTIPAIGASAATGTGPGVVHALNPAVVAELKLSAPLRSSTAAVPVFIRTTGQGALSVDATAKGGDLEGKPQSSAAKTRVADIRRTNAAVTAAVTAADTSAKRLYSTAYTIPGIAVLATPAALKAVAARSDVVSITAISARSIPDPATTTVAPTDTGATPKNTASDTYTRAVNAWQQTGHIGKDVNVAVIDTGLDYTHADFGGPGTTAAYTAALASTASPDPTLFDAKKFLGGYDFAGATYNADSSTSAYDPYPDPDPNPIDGKGGGHGSHVAGTIAGYGVTANKTTFRGDYSTLTDETLHDLYIGPGSAPSAGLYSLKIFGDGGGSTDLIGAALDWVGQALTEGKNINVVNMSVGADNSSPDDPDAAKVNALVERGVLPVIASGNSGDVTDVGGSPGNSKDALTVAASSSGSGVFDGINVTAPTSLATGNPYLGIYSQSYTSPIDLTGKVVLPSTSNTTGCNTFSAADRDRIAGNIVLLDWDDANLPCGSATRFGNAGAAGATGVLLGGRANLFENGIAGDVNIPGALLTQKAYAALLPAAQAGTLTVSLNDSLRRVKEQVDSDAADTLATFSSRGVHGSYNDIVKPDVSAPGVNVQSVLAGSGTDKTTESGTSMATPHTAGIAALAFEAHPGWTAQQVKADVMNTATHDTKNQAGTLYSTLSQGTGRVDALQAVTNQVTIQSAENTGLVTASFGVVAVTKPVTLTRTLVVSNSGNTSRTYALAYQDRIAQPGVTFTLSSPQVTVPARGTTKVTLTMTVKDPKALRKVIDPTQSVTGTLNGVTYKRNFVPAATGYVTLTPTAAGTSSLRLSVFAAPKPASSMHSTGATFSSKKATRATLNLQGTTVNQGSGSQNYTSLSAPFVLGATSPKMSFTGSTSAQSLAATDLLEVGAASTAPTLKDKSAGIVSFGVHTAGSTANPGATAYPEILLDVNNDSRADFQIYAAKSQSMDTVLSVTQDLATGNTVDVEPYNANTLQQDVNTFDSSVSVLSVRLSALGYTAKTTKTAISYVARTESIYAPNRATTGNYVVDSTKAVRFDVYKPTIWFSQKGAPHGGVLFTDASPGIFINRSALSSSKVLLLHLHNTAAQQSQVIVPTTRK